MLGFLSPEAIANFLLLWFGLGFLALALITPGLIAEDARQMRVAEASNWEKVYETLILLEYKVIPRPAAWKKEPEQGC